MLCYNLDCEVRSSCREIRRFGNKNFKCSGFMDKKQGEKEGVTLKNVVFLTELRRALRGRHKIIPTPQQLEAKRKFSIKLIQIRKRQLKELA